MKNKHDKNCPNCNHKMQALLFMGVQLDGYACDNCKLFYPIDDSGKMKTTPLATII